MLNEQLVVGSRYHHYIANLLAPTVPTVKYQAFQKWI